MTALLESEAFRNELPGWVLRGVLCALGSAFWAVMMGFETPAEIAGMVAGVVFWSTGFAGLCCSTRLLAGLKQPRLGSALKRAAWIKLGLTTFGWALMFGAGSLRFHGVEVLGIFGMIDAVLGLASLWLVGEVGSFPDFGQICRANSFGWTALTTLVDGALTAIVIGLIAAAVLGWWHLTAGSGRKQELSPARPAG